MNGLVGSVRKLLEEASDYVDLLKAGINEMRASIELVDTGEAATLILGDEACVVEGFASPDFKMSMSSQTFRNVVQGKADAFALASRAETPVLGNVAFTRLGGLSPGWTLTSTADTPCPHRSEIPEHSRTLARSIALAS